jgi:hypothetical protein
MVIKASSAAEIGQLVAALDGDDDLRREAAIARLAVIGPRAVDRLIEAYASASRRDAKIAILRALEPLADPRTAIIARHAISERGDLAVAAAGALRMLLDSSHRPTAVEALDALIAAALDAAAEHRVRLAAFEALQDLPPEIRARVVAALQNDPDPALKARAIDAPRDAADADAVWRDALDGRFPDSAGRLREVAQSRTAAAPLTSLQKMIDALRAHERTVVPEGRRVEWQAVRGALHQALALRESRLAVYDLRETLEETRSALPASFLGALHKVGDASCLEPLAAAYERASGEDAHWRHQLGAAFHAIGRRDKVTRRHAVMKRIESRWPVAARELLHGSRGVLSPSRQYAFANHASPGAGRPHLTQTPATFSAPNGMFRSVAWVSALICASHSARPHQPAITNPGRPSMTAFSSS